MKIKYFIAKLIKKLHIPAVKDSKIDKTARVCSGSHLVSVEMGRYSYVGNNCTVADTKIGNFCSIADNCIIGGASHPLHWVSTSPVFYKGKNIMGKHFAELDFPTTQRTIIGNDVWLGSCCLIKSGVMIGDGAVIGMGAVVTKDVGAYEIWGGNPARLIKKRFENGVIDELLQSKWWDMSDEQLMTIAPLFLSVEKSIIHIKGESAYE